MRAEMKWIALAGAFAGIDLVLDLVLARAFGVGWTLGWILTTAVVGVVLGKRMGLNVLLRWRDALSAGRAPEEGLLAGALVVVAAILLVLPGPLGDVFGALLLLRPVRIWLGARIGRRFGRAVQDGRVHVVSYASTVMSSAPSPGAMRDPGPAGIIDVEGEIVDGPDSGGPKRLGS